MGRRTRLVLLGGFLGAGKTTTLLRLAREIVARGQTIGILANDQGEELVDTEIFRAAGFDTRDVRGGCFCCRLDDFLAQAKALATDAAPDFLLAEPVGSCTDLVATVLRPLAQWHADSFALAPYTVVVDPLRAHDVLAPDGRASLSEKVTYVYRMQQMEAGVIAIGKADLLAPDEAAEVEGLLAKQFPGKAMLRYSARTGEGFASLATMLLGDETPPLPASPEIDYDVYADGEAELAWFDGRFAVSARQPMALEETLSRLGARLCDRIVAAGLDVVHVKLLARHGARVARLNMTSAQPSLARARPKGATAEAVDLYVNARVAGRPERLHAAVEAALGDWARSDGLAFAVTSVAAFSPSRPVPFARIA